MQRKQVGIISRTRLLATQLLFIYPGESVFASRLLRGGHKWLSKSSITDSWRLGLCPKVFVLSMAMVLTSCSQEADLLHGRWQAVEITQAGDSMRLDPSEVSFVFEPEGIYHYRSTLNYQEAGHYRYETGYLFATDTSHQGREERVVAAQLLGTDSLRIKMKHDTTERFMLFIKQ